MQALINNFLDRKLDFSSLSFIEQVKYMAYFYTRSTDDSVFTPQNIASFFDLAKLNKPKNISDILSKNKKIFIQYKNGYVLNRDEIKILDREFIEHSESEEDFKERFYESGDQFDFYQDIKKIILNASKQVFIIDSYVDEDLLEIYLEKLPLGVEIRVLTNSYSNKGNFVSVARMFAKKRGVKFESRESAECHDRAIFVDGFGWVIGNSIKNTAKNKPTYMLRLSEPIKLEKIYNRVWASASKIV